MSNFVCAHSHIPQVTNSFTQKKWSSLLQHERPKFKVGMEKLDDRAWELQDREQGARFLV